MLAVLEVSISDGDIGIEGSLFEILVLSDREGSVIDYI
jgi:hypothetical protein